MKFKASLWLKELLGTEDIWRLRSSTVFSFYSWWVYMCFTVTSLEKLRKTKWGYRLCITDPFGFFPHGKQLLALSRCWLIYASQDSGSSYFSTLEDSCTLREVWCHVISSLIYGSFCCIFFILSTWQHFYEENIILHGSIWFLILFLKYPIIS